MNEVFQEFLHRFVVVYIDILIYSWNLAEHRQHVQQSLPQAREFLGYIISAEGMQMDQGKVSAIQEWPQPLTVKELQRFLGFSNFYRRFIKDYSSIMAPLTSLLRGKPKTLNWNPSAHKAFQQLKKIFSTAPLLHHPDPELPFTVEVDASTTTPVVRCCPKRAFYSRKLSPAEQNYNVGNRELLAIKLALEEWRHWLEGSTHPTDPLALTIPILVAQYAPGYHQVRLELLCLCYVYLSLSTPYRQTGVDFVIDLPAAEGNTCILVMVDRFSKMCKFFPLKGLPTALETAELLFQQLFRHFGLPEEIVSDRGPHFISHAWKAFFKLLGVSVNLSSGYHPQTNGQTERKIQELGRYLRAYCHKDEHSWSRFLPLAEYAQNSLRQDTTGLTPFQCVLGYQPPLFPWMEEPSNVPAVDH
ncbi:hypothetical protein M9458_036644, partial [Cirrhinus mrigala]